MPYKDPKQATAVFLNIKRRRGMAAAKAFGRKHREDFKSEGRPNRPYRSRRSK